MKRNRLYLAISAALKGGRFQDWLDWHDVMAEGQRAVRKGAFATAVRRTCADHDKSISPPSRTVAVSPSMRVLHWLIGCLPAP